MDPSEFDDESLATLKELPYGLYRVNLRDAQITDTGMKHLRGLTSLQTLWLSNTQITDAGLKNLEGQYISHLELNDTRVTDAGLDHLRTVTGLRELDLRRTRVTDEGVKNLQQALPKCRITH